MKKPYAVFCGYTYYPAPGWQGYFGDAPTLDTAEEIARQKIEEYSFDWWQVVYLPDKEIVSGEGSGQTGLMGKIDANPGQE